MAEGYLTTHVLDTARGCPAEGIHIELFRITDSTRTSIAQATTNADGRTDSPILPKGKLSAGTYELVFLTGNYLSNAGLTTSDIKFLDEIPIRFGIDDDNLHYHVPLLLSPYGYSTYRGS
ncbi:MAG: hydroxyisourate hydrolase [Aliishimia sp.]